VCHGSDILSRSTKQGCFRLFSLRLRLADSGLRGLFFNFDSFAAEISRQREIRTLFPVDNEEVDPQLAGMTYAFPKTMLSDLCEISVGRCRMEDADIERRFHLMQKEIEAAVALIGEFKLDLKAAIDSLRIELEVLKSYMERYHPGFAESYPKFKEEAIQSIDPEWMGSEAAKKLGG
jgi:hypothetical protein